MNQKKVKILRKYHVKVAEEGGYKVTAKSWRRMKKHYKGLPEAQKKLVKYGN